MEDVRYFDKAASKTVKKYIGLVIEPNLFRVIYFSDVEGKSPIGFRDMTDGEFENNSELEGLTPLFAFDFHENYVLTPYGMFQESDYAKILGFTTSFESNDLRSDRIIGFDCLLLSESIKKNEELVSKWFPGLRLRHLVGAILELGRHQILHTKPGIVLFRTGTVFNISVLSHNKLILSNAINTEFLSDMEYMVHYAANQLKLDNATPIYILGRGEETKQLSEKLTSYFRNVSLGFPHHNYHESEMDLGEHWLSIHASQCAL
jgi:hypothetical protein